jgi:hypothetical protein
MPQSKERHAEYMKNYRVKKDKIDMEQEEQTEKVSQQPTKRKRRELTPVDDAWGSDLHDEAQYPKMHESLGANIFGTSQEPQQTKPKSYQAILRELDSKHSE